MYLSRVIFTRQVTTNFPEKKQKCCSPEWRLGLPSALTFPGVRGNYPLWVGWQSDIERAAEEGYMEKERERYTMADKRKKGQHNSLIHPDNTNPNAAAHCAI